MDKFLKILIEQNPKCEIVCNNKSCKIKSKVKTADLFSGGDTFVFVCPYCKSENTITGINAWIKNIKNEFKKNGITW